MLGVLGPMILCTLSDILLPMYIYAHNSYIEIYNYMQHHHHACMNVTELLHV